MDDFSDESSITPSERLEYALMSAVDDNDRDKIMQIDGDEKIFSRALIHACLEKSSLEIIESLLKQGAKAAANYTYYGLGPALHVAAFPENRSSRPELLDLLLRYCTSEEINCSNEGSTALHVATWESIFAAEVNEDAQKAAIRSLVRAGADMLAGAGEDDYNPFHTACGNRLTAVKQLWELAVDKDLDIVNSTTSSGVTPLMCAAERRAVNIVKFLVEKGANVQARDKNGDTALHYVCRNTSSCSDREEVEIVKILLNGGANVDTLGQCGETALHLSSARGSARIVELLLSARPKPTLDIQNDHGATALLYDRSDFEHIHYHPEQILAASKLLLDAGINVNNQDHQGYTALHKACRTSCFGHRDDKDTKELQLMELVKVLLKAGAHEAMGFFTNEGFTPVALAAKNGHLDIVRLLVEWGGAELATDSSGNHMNLDMGAVCKEEAQCGPPPKRQRRE